MPPLQLGEHCLDHLICLAVLEFIGENKNRIQTLTPLLKKIY